MCRNWKGFLEMRMARVKIRMKHHYNKKEYLGNGYCLGFSETILVFSSLIANKLSLLQTPFSHLCYLKIVRSIYYIRQGELPLPENTSHFFIAYLSLNKRTNSHHNTISFCLLIFMFYWYDRNKSLVGKPQKDLEAISKRILRKSQGNQLKADICSGRDLHSGAHRVHRHRRKEWGARLLHSHRKLFPLSPAVQQLWLMPADNSS